MVVEKKVSRVFLWLAAERRKAEATQAAALLGAPVHFLGLGDAEAFDTPEIRARFIELLRITRPELVPEQTKRDLEPIIGKYMK